MIEHFAFDLVDSKLDVVFPVGIGGCFDARALLAGRIDYHQIDALRGGNSNLDFAAVPDAKLSSCRSDFAILTEFSRYYSESERFPDAAQKYADLVSSGEVLARFPAVAGKIGGRPEVIVVDLREATANRQKAAGSAPSD